MKIASLILGIIGGIAGLIGATLALGVGGLGAALAIAKPKISAWMQLVLLGY